MSFLVLDDHHATIALITIFIHLYQIYYLLRIFIQRIIALNIIQQGSHLCYHLYSNKLGIGDR